MSKSIKRREFMKYGASIASASTLGTRAYAQPSEKGNRKFDQYGGHTGLTFEATGFFRTEKTDRWWLVTPEGNAFLSFGINHFNPYLYTQKYNVSSWKDRLGTKETRGKAFNEKLRSWFKSTCQEFGFNTVGVHNYLPLVNTPRPFLPYMQPIKFVMTPHWRHGVKDEHFVDVFAPAFAAHCDNLARKHTKPLDPYLLGYSMTDCTMFTEEDLRERTDVIGGSREKDASAGREGSGILPVRNLENRPM